MSQESLGLVSYIISIIIGVAFLVCLFWAKIKNKPFTKYSVLAGVLGVVLVGLPLWSSISLNMTDTDMSLTFKTIPDSDPNIVEPVKMDQQHGEKIIPAVVKQPVKRQQEQSEVFVTQDSHQHLHDPDIALWANMLGMDYHEVEQLGVMLSEF